MWDDGRAIISKASVGGKVAWMVTASMLLPFFLTAPSQAQSFAPAQVYGCWRLDAPKKVGENRVAFSTMCFRPDGTLYFSSIAPEGGGDELLDWQLIIPKKNLVIDGQVCPIGSGSNDATLHLSRCLYMGAWVRDCRFLEEDRTGCQK
jgi:hypothetical protein